MHSNKQECISSRMRGGRGGLSRRRVVCLGVSVQRGGVVCHVTYLIMHLMLPVCLQGMLGYTHPCGQTDTCKNITFANVKLCKALNLILVKRLYKVSISNPTES